VATGGYGPLAALSAWPSPRLRTGGLAPRPLSALSASPPAASRATARRAQGGSAPRQHAESGGRSRQSWWARRENCGGRR
jgi:hypothetical protein